LSIHQTTGPNTCFPDTIRAFLACLAFHAFPAQAIGAELIADCYKIMVSMKKARENQQATASPHIS
jgi:hypothetical protein